MELKIGDKMYCALYGELELVSIQGGTLNDSDLLSLGFAPPRGYNYYLFKTNARSGLYTTIEGKIHPHDKMRQIFTRDEAKMFGMKLPPKLVNVYQAVVKTDKGMILTNTLYKNTEEAEKEHGSNLVGLSKTAITYEVQEEL